MLRPASIITSVSALCLLSVPALAQLDVAIVAAASTNPTDCRYTGPQMKLMATGQFNSVSIVDATAATPTLVDLMAFDAIVTWSNFDYQDSVAFGDVLADYVDAGGGVVVATFANSDTSLNRSMQGRWLMGYEVILAGSGQITGQSSLGAVQDPGHPIMSGVNTFDGGSLSFRPNLTNLAAGAASIAEWSDGRVLVAVGVQPNRADLGFYPPSSDCSANFWNSSTDGDLLLANALSYVAVGGAGLGVNYCGPGVANSSGQPGSMGLTGSAVAADMNLVAVASQVPTGEFAYFIASRTQGFVANPGGSQGHLCVLGDIARFNRAGEVGAIAAGQFSLALPMGDFPEPPVGSVVVMAGDTWNFQCWHRDFVNGVPTSNFTDGISLTFQ